MEYLYENRKRNRFKMQIFLVKDIFKEIFLLIFKANRIWFGQIFLEIGSVLCFLIFEP